MNAARKGYWEGLPYRAAAIIGRTTRDIFRSRGFIFAMIFILIPVYISIYTLLDPQEGMKEWWGLFVVFGLVLYLQLLVLIYCMIYGSSMVNEDIDSRTMTYLIIRGSKRAEIYFWKYIGTVLSLIIMFTISIVTTYLLLAGHGPVENIFYKADILLVLLLSTYIGIVVFSAIFASFGTVTKRPLMVGLLYAFFWEIIMVNIPFNISNMTMMHFIRSIYSGNEVVDGKLDFRNMTDPTFSWIFLLCCAAIFLSIGAFKLSRKDIH